MRPITSSSDWAPLNSKHFEVHTEDNDPKYDPNNFLRLYCGFHDRDPIGGWPSLSSFHEQPFLTYVLPDGTFTNQANELALEDGKLQRIPRVFRYTLFGMSEGLKMTVVARAGEDFEQSRRYFFRLEKRIPLTGHQYNLCHLPLNHRTVTEILQSLEYSRELVPDVRRLGNATLLAANEFLIPILQAVYGGASMSEDFLRVRNIERKEFLFAAVDVVKYGNPLAQSCYEMGIRLCGLAIEFTIMAPETVLDPGIVQDSALVPFERMDTRPNSVVGGSSVFNLSVVTAWPGVSNL